MKVQNSKLHIEFTSMFANQNICGSIPPPRQLPSAMESDDEARSRSSRRSRKRCSSHWQSRVLKMWYQPACASAVPPARNDWMVTRTHRGPKFIFLKEELATSKPSLRHMPRSFANVVLIVDNRGSWGHGVNPPAHLPSSSEKQSTSRTSL